jgi:hypothetical protein
MCRSFFQNLLDRPDFTRIYLDGYKACRDDKLPENPVINGEEALDKWVDELTSAIQEATAASAPKRRTRAPSTG